MRRLGLQPLYSVLERNVLQREARDFRSVVLQPFLGGAGDAGRVLALGGALGALLGDASRAFQLSDDVDPSRCSGRDTYAEERRGAAVDVGWGLLVFVDFMVGGMDDRRAIMVQLMSWWYV